MVNIEYVLLYACPEGPVRIGGRAHAPVLGKSEGLLRLLRPSDSVEPVRRLFEREPAISEVGLYRGFPNGPKYCVLAGPVEVFRRPECL